MKLNVIIFIVEAHVATQSSTDTPSNNRKQKLVKNPNLQEENQLAVCNRGVNSGVLRNNCRELPDQDLNPGLPDYKPFGSVDYKSFGHAALNFR